MLRTLRTHCEHSFIFAAHGLPCGCLPAGRGVLLGGVPGTEPAKVWQESWPRLGNPLRTYRSHKHAARLRTQNDMLYIVEQQIVLHCSNHFLHHSIILFQSICIIIIYTIRSLFLFAPPPFHPRSPSSVPGWSVATPPRWPSAQAPRLWPHPRLAGS